MQLHRRVVLGGLLAAGLPTHALGQETEPSPNVLGRIGGRVYLNGSHQGQFLLHTGVGKTILSEDMMGLLRLRQQGQTSVTGLTASANLPRVQLDTLRLSNQDFTRVEAGVMPRNRVGGDGVIGLDLLSRFALVLDPERRNSRLVPPILEFEINERTATGTNIKPLWTRAVRRGERQLVFGDVEVEGVPARAFINTGADLSIANPALIAALRDRGLTPAPRRLSPPVMTVVGDPPIGELYRPRSLRIGGERFGETELASAEMSGFADLGLADEPAVMLGMDAINRFARVTIDYLRVRVAFEGRLRQSA